VEKKGIQDGEDQAGKEVGQFDLLQTQQVDADGDDHDDGMPVFMENLVTHGHLHLEDEIRRLLLQISPAMTLLSPSLAPPWTWWVETEDR
jgi:hypothetical protein